MSLRYDFDIYYADPEDTDGTALFRDTDTVEAILGASPVVREFFEAAGFGFDTYDSGAPDGRFPRADLPAIKTTVKRLSESAKSFPLKGQDWNGFSLKTFREHIKAMKPIDMGAPEPAHDDGPTEMTPIERIRARQSAKRVDGPSEPQPEIAYGAAAFAGMSSGTMETEHELAGPPPGDPNVGIPQPKETAAPIRDRSRFATPLLMVVLLLGVGLAVGAVYLKPEQVEAEAPPVAEDNGTAGGFDAVALFRATLGLDDDEEQMASVTPEVESNLAVPVEATPDPEVQVRKMLDALHRGEDPNKAIQDMGETVQTIMKDAADQLAKETSQAPERTIVVPPKPGVEPAQ